MTWPATLRLWAVLLLALLLPAAGRGEEPPPFAVARLKYGGGGDWYADPSSLPNLQRFLGRTTGMAVAPREAVVEAADERLFQYPVLYLTGHGRVSFGDEEQQRLRLYLEHGGFLHCDDNYGLDEHFRREIARVLPGRELVEVPFDHPVYHSWFSFPRGLPKIHEHDGKPPRGYGIFIDGRLAVFYSWECDLGDGWEDPEVHELPESLRRQALEMGTNILCWALGVGPDRLPAGN
jgi:hypothetical protein